METPEPSHCNGHLLPLLPQDDVMLELHADDMVGEVAEDMLTELAFYVPPGNEDFPSSAEDVPAAKVRAGCVCSGAAEGGMCPLRHSGLGKR